MTLSSAVLAPEVVPYQLTRQWVIPTGMPDFEAVEEAVNAAWTEIRGLLTQGFSVSKEPLATVTDGIVAVSAEVLGPFGYQYDERGGLS